nr:FecR domain-containing protein [Polyangium spumosum]
MEQELLQRIAEDEQARASRALPRIGRGARVGLALCAAAAAAIAVASFGARTTKDEAPAGVAIRWRAPETITFLPGSESERDLSLLRPGDGVAAGEAPLVLVLRGAVRVTLAPGARAAVVVAPSQAGEALVLGLEQGSLRADVTPRKTEGLVETFAVDVGRTRVAAHGTAFTVTRGPDDVLVDLEHGAVAVGPAGRSGVTTGRLLVGRARASFSLDGGETARMLPVDEDKAPPAPPATTEPQPSPKPAIALPPATVAERPLAPAPDRPDAPAAPPPPAPAPSVVPEVPPSPKPAPVLTRASVHAGLSGCFDTLYGGRDPSVRLSVTATVTVSLDEEGAVSSVRFDPPLEPPFMQCVFDALRPGKFVGASGNLSVPFQLGR